MVLATGQEMLSLNPTSGKHVSSGSDSRAQKMTIAPVMNQLFWDSAEYLSRSDSYFSKGSHDIEHYHS